MAIRTIAELKSYFQGAYPGPDRTTAQQFTDLFDSLQWFDDMANAALAAASPVILVPNQATMFLNGPVYKVGQRIKTLDDGLTWVKQNQPGTVIGDYAPIGDTAITIPDVNGLQDALDARMTRDQVDDEVCVGRLGVRNTAASTIGTWPLTGGAPADLLMDPFGPTLNYAGAALTTDTNLIWGTVTPGDPNGRSVTGFMYNGAISPIEVRLSSGMMGTNGAWPVILSPSKWMAVTMTFFTHPTEGTVLLMAFNNEI